jgi:thermitase
MPPSPATPRWLALAVTAAAVATISPATAAGAPVASREILVKFRPGTPAAVVGAAERRIGAELDRGLPELGIRVLSVPESGRAAAVRRLRRSGLAEFVEADEPAFTLGRSSRTVIPSDPLWPSEWGLRAIGAPRAWATTRGDRGVVVATLDSGVDAAHPDLRAALVPGRNVVADNDVPTDDNGHGTAVAGLVAARAENGIGITGVCPRCSLMPVKVTDASGTATDSNVAAGLTWAVDHGARVINVSLGAAVSSQTIAAAVRYASDRGAIVVAAAGNGGSGAAFYPAADEGVLSVGATDGAGRLFSWSNFGGWVDVAAPGCGVTTAPGGLYENFCGTSASAPMVAGAVALALAAAPGGDPGSVIRAVAATARPVGGIVSGRIDAAAAVRFVVRRRAHHFRAVRLALIHQALEVRASGR